MTVKDLTEAGAKVVLAILLAVLALIVVMAVRTAPAHAGWPEDEFRAQHRKNIVRRHVYRESHRHRRRETRKVIVIREAPKLEREFEGRHCLSKPITMTGHESRVTDPVKSAEKAWAAQVAFNHGQVFADLQHAKLKTLRCPEPGPETIVDRATGVFGADTRKRVCQIEAVPCMAPALKWRAKAQ